MKSTGSRILSLDVFRGLAVAAMIIVNNPGNWEAVYAPFEHAHWDGLTIADIVFPSFVFIVGVALPFTFARRLERAGRLDMLQRIVLRSVALIALGLVLNLADKLPGFVNVRIPGVLQRIALAYAIAAPLVLLGSVRAWITATGVLLACHAIILRWVPFGGVPAGTLDELQNISGWIDIQVFGPHILTPTVDPEGLLGTLSTAATMLCGSMAGVWLRVTPQPRRRVIGLFIGGGLAAGIGLLWSLWLPLNKTLWTPSYALTTAGIASAVFAVCYAVVDVKRVRGWAAPFIWLGANPLAIYFLSELARHLMDFGWISQSGATVGAKDALFWRYLTRWLGGVGGQRASLTFALVFTGLWIGVAGVLYRRGVRFRV